MKIGIGTNCTKRLSYVRFFLTSTSIFNPVAWDQAPGTSSLIRSASLALPPSQLLPRFRFVTLEGASDVNVTYYNARPSLRRKAFSANPLDAYLLNTTAVVPPKVHYIPHTSICLFWILERKIRDFVDTALEAYKPLP